MISAGSSLSGFRRIAALSFLLWLMAFPGHAFPGMPDIIDRIKPSIVAVGTFDKTRSPSFKVRGTGFALGNGNLVATNTHVLPEILNSESNEALVVLVSVRQGVAQQRPARVVASDKDHDLSLLQIEGPALPAMTLRGEGFVREGQEVAFTGFPIGNALGLSPVTHRGMISAITPIALPSPAANQLNEKAIKRLKSGAFDVYQLDGTAYPGNSGGPLFSVENGEVIGIINMVFVKGSKESALSQPSGISFAVPVHYLRELLQTVR